MICLRQLSVGWPLIFGVAGSIGMIAAIPSVFAQSQVDREWMLFHQILYIGIGVGIVVFGIMFYALIKYREKPKKEGSP
jgi:heme/copper-type cytochrome/quinol oxidase subunit 2